jgi:hypothetical protein
MSPETFKQPGLQSAGSRARVTFDRKRLVLASRNRSHLRGSCLRPPGFCFRTIWAAPQPRAARPLWSEAVAQTRRAKFRLCSKANCAPLWDSKSVACERRVPLGALLARHRFEALCANPNPVCLCDSLVSERWPGRRRRPRKRRAAHRGSERRVDVGIAVGQDAKCRPLRPQALRCPMEKATQGHPRRHPRACVWRPSA